MTVLLLAFVGTAQADDGLDAWLGYEVAPTWYDSRQTTADGLNFSAAHHLRGRAEAREILFQLDLGIMPALDLNAPGLPMQTTGWFGLGPVLLDGQFTPRLVVGGAVDPVARNPATEDQYWEGRPSAGMGFDLALHVGPFDGNWTTWALADRETGGIGTDLNGGLQIYGPIGVGLGFELRRRVLTLADERIADTWYGFRGGIRVVY